MTTCTKLYVFVQFVCHALEFEKKRELDPGLIVSTIVRAGGNSAWCRMERGEFPSTQLSQHLSEDIKSLVCFMPFTQYNILFYVACLTKGYHLSSSLDIISIGKCFIYSFICSCNQIEIYYMYIFICNVCM